MIAEQPRHAVVEPWSPQVGDWVRIRISAECRAFHSQLRSEVGRVAYGRVEMIDRTMDVAEHWHVVIEESPPDMYTEADAQQDARKHAGHYYMVQDCAVGQVVDALDGVPDDRQRGPVTLVDGFYCAFELTKVPAAEAVRGIARARREMRSMTDGQRLYAAVMGAR